MLAPLQNGTEPQNHQLCLLFKLKGIVHFEIYFWNVLAYLKGIQDVGVFVSAVVSIIKSSNQIMFNLDFSVHAL